MNCCMPRVGEFPKLCEDELSEPLVELLRFECVGEKKASISWGSAAGAPMKRLLSGGSGGPGGTGKSGRQRISTPATIEKEEAAARCKEELLPKEQEKAEGGARL